MARQGERAKHAYVEAVAVSGEELAAFCERWRIVELAFFGSVLRDDFGPHSDVDVLVRFHPEAKHLMGLDRARGVEPGTRPRGGLARAHGGRTEPQLHPPPGD